MIDSATAKELPRAGASFVRRYGYLAVGRSKTEAGEGRTIPLNSTLLEVFAEYGEWYRQKFGKPRHEWYVFPSENRVRATPRVPSPHSRRHGTLCGGTPK